MLQLIPTIVLLVYTHLHYLNIFPELCVPPLSFLSFNLHKRQSVVDFASFWGGGSRNLAIGNVVSMSKAPLLLDPMTCLYFPQALFQVMADC